MATNVTQSTQPTQASNKQPGVAEGGTGTSDTLLAATSGVEDASAPTVEQGQGRRDDGSSVANRTQTSFVPPELYTYLTSPDHTVTAAYGEAPPGTPVRAIAEKLFGNESHPSGYWANDHGGEHGTESVDGEKKGEKGLRGLMGKLGLKKDADGGHESVEARDYERGQARRFGKDDDDHAYNHAADDLTGAMRPLDEQQLAEVRKCGNWGGAEPSELFLNIYGHALKTLDKNALNGMVSPALMAGTGVVPATVISVIPDIMQHHANLIVGAQHEVFLATNYWEASGAAALVCDAFRELSRRAVARGGPPVVVKLMYDRGTPKQVMSPHQLVQPKIYTGSKVKLPAPDEIPGIQLQVLNYHLPPVGTFHSKYMVIDRKVAIMNSNNIQDRVNLEMMVQIEGPIVQGFYDMALLSWSTIMEPPLPLLKMPPKYPVPGSKDLYQWGKPTLHRSGTQASVSQSPMSKQADVAPAESVPQTDLGPRVKTGERYRSGMPVLGSTPTSVEASAQDAFTGAASQRDATGTPGAESASVAPHNTTVGAAFSGDSPGAPTGAVTNLKPVPADPYAGQRHWDDSLTEEAERINGGLKEPQSVSKHLNTGTPVSATDHAPPTTPFSPIVLLPPHDPVPMAMVNRSPRGLPGHGDTHVPQDVAWLAGFKFATKRIFIQTPTFNAKPIVAAALEAVKRGIVVEIYADLGFNDEASHKLEEEKGNGELLPYQGGTNEMVADYMYKQLAEADRDLLRMYWYTGKDQVRPINAKDKSRNCHVKIMIVDDQIAIQGNGNQSVIDIPPDSQSWYHSQEANILVDSADICSQWRAALDTNQNTKLFGRINPDGIWRDTNNQELSSQKPLPHGPLKSLQGVKGAIQRVRGEGGF